MSAPENQLEIAVGPTVSSYTITYSAKSPGNARITWYQDNIELSERTNHLMNDTGGSSTIQVNQRSHKGKYRVVVESLFNGLLVPEYISEMSIAEYSFDVEIVGESISIIIP